MSFTINCYINKNPVNKVDKSLGSVVFSEEGDLLEPTNIMKPSIKLKTDNENFLKCNYCYIEIFNRYYFIDSIDIIQNKIYQINCSVDVLKTYAEQIKQQSGIIDKQKSEHINKYYNDGTFVTEERTDSTVLEFPNHIFSGGTLDEDWAYVLTCYGGIDTESE